QFVSARLERQTRQYFVRKISCRIRWQLDPDRLILGIDRTAGAIKRRGEYLHRRVALAGVRPNLLSNTEPDSDVRFWFADSTKWRHSDRERQVSAWQDSAQR